MKLRRRQTVYDAGKPQGFIQKVDQASTAWCWKPTRGITPFGAFLLIFTSALLVGGAVWLYNNEPLSGLFCRPAWE